MGHSANDSDPMTSSCDSHSASCTRNGHYSESDRIIWPGLYLARCGSFAESDLPCCFSFLGNCSPWSCSADNGWVASSRRYLLVFDLDLYRAKRKQGIRQCDARSG